MLVLGKNAPAITVDTDAAKQLLNAFEQSAEPLVQQKTRGTLRGTTGLIPSLGDIGKVFDSIMMAIEWFKTRNDKQRHELADILEATDIRPWSEAGTPKPEKKQSITDTSSGKPKTKGQGN